jgi:hypothetical protein
MLSLLANGLKIVQGEIKVENVIDGFSLELQRVLSGMYSEKNLRERKEKKDYIKKEEIVGSLKNCYIFALCLTNKLNEYVCSN